MPFLFKRPGPILRKALACVVVIFIAMNVIAFIHAYKFTHFSNTEVERTKDPTELSTVSKMTTLLTGIDNPKPKHKRSPSFAFKPVHIQSDVRLEAWHSVVHGSRGTVVLFHGYSGEKSSLISRAEEFIQWGYSTLLVDFEGSGGSEGSETSIGFTEAREVKDVFDYVTSMGEQRVILFGTSMGAAAILKCIDDYKIEPASIILECPFGSLYQTVCARFRMMGVPPFPMAALLTLWGGAQQGYWAFGHNPGVYAKSVTCPALLMFGEDDDRVSMEETQMIFDNMKGPKELSVYPGIGHSIFVPTNERAWTADVSSFLTRHSQ
jgi:uncharacterized protein